MSNKKTKKQNWVHLSLKLENTTLIKNKDLRNEKL
tara:strand:- start:1842 stop:1946 length:105 start_codon:yes stop_codon:yes gene_type:complete